MRSASFDAAVETEEFYQARHFKHKMDSTKKLENGKPNIARINHFSDETD